MLINTILAHDQLASREARIPGSAISKGLGACDNGEPSLVQRESAISSRPLSLQGCSARTSSLTALLANWHRRRDIVTRVGKDDRQ